MDLLIVGASARAAAFSAVRAGLTVGAIDLFADRDLAAIARCVRVPPAAYPSGLLDAADDFPLCPWIYTGGLENRPDLVAELTRRRPLWGNGPAVLRQVRDPLRLARMVRDAGLPAPRVQLDPAGLPCDGSWLRKPLASAGGHGIAALRSIPAPPPSGSPARPRSYYQERVSGLPLSAVYLGIGMTAQLVGVTLQLVGYPRATFAYRGSLAPWPVPPAAEARIIALGAAVAWAFELVGLFGVDFILRDDWPWVVEVNPRYTASVEVIELATGSCLLSDHRAACQGCLSISERPGATRHVAKEIVFATGDQILVTEPSRLVEADPGSLEMPEVADLPDPGARFRAGEPVLTVFARGATPDATLRSLAAARRRWASCLQPAGAI